MHVSFSTHGGPFALITFGSGVNSNELVHSMLATPPFSSADRPPLVLRSLRNVLTSSLFSCSLFLLCSMSHDFSHRRHTYPHHFVPSVIALSLSLWVIAFSLVSSCFRHCTSVPSMLFCVCHLHYVLLLRHPWFSLSYVCYAMLCRSSLMLSSNTTQAWSCCSFCRIRASLRLFP